MVTDFQNGNSGWKGLLLIYIDTSIKLLYCYRDGVVPNVSLS